MIGIERIKRNLTYRREIREGAHNAASDGRTSHPDNLLQPEKGIDEPSSCKTFRKQLEVAKLSDNIKVHVQKPEVFRVMCPQIMQEGDHSKL